MATNEELRKKLDAAIKEAGSATAWAEKNDVSEASISMARYSSRDFPIIVADRLGYDERDKEELDKWVLKKPTKKK